MQPTLLPTTAIQFTVLGSPVAQPRQRHAMIAGHVHNYTPSRHPVQQFRLEVKAAGKEVAPPAPLDGPIILEARFYLPRPQKLMRKRDPEGPVWHTAKPDLDNLLKAVKDSLKGIMWRDDSQVVSYGPNHGKWYAEKTGRPRVEITIREAVSAG